jgi:hypothetical protein
MCAASTAASDVNKELIGAGQSSLCLKYKCISYFIKKYLICTWNLILKEKIPPNGTN